MIQCSDCEYFNRNSDGEISFGCDPFGTIKEPECLGKWQLIKINQLVATYQATLEYYRKLAPMQEKMFKVVERELDDMNESEGAGPPDRRCTRRHDHPSPTRPRRPELACFILGCRVVAVPGMMRAQRVGR